MPFLKEEKSEHERARTFMLAVQVCCARHCELPLSKMGNKGLFPGVAVPLAFFCTLFFRHRKKSVSAPWDGQSQSAPESARQALPGEFLTAKLLLIDASRGLSARPLHPFGSPTETIERPIGLQVLLPRRSRRVKPRQGEFLRQSCRLLLQAGWLSARPPAPPSGRTRRAEQGVAPAGALGAFRSPPCTPFGSPLEAIERPIGLQALSLHRLRRATPRQSKTTPGRKSLLRRGPLGCFVIPSPRPPSRRTRCISGTPDRKPRWAGSPASAWPSLRPCPPSRSRPSGTVRQWGWSCIS